MDDTIYLAYDKLIEAGDSAKEREKRRAVLEFVLSPVEEAEARLSPRDCATVDVTPLAGQPEPPAPCPWRVRKRSPNWAPHLLFLECPTHGLVRFDETVPFRTIRGERFDSVEGDDAID